MKTISKMSDWDQERLTEKKVKTETDKFIQPVRKRKGWYSRPQSSQQLEKLPYEASKWQCPYNFNTE